MTTNEMNSFEQHGFQTPSFEGEILKEVDGEYFGYVFDIEIIRNVAIKWSSLGVVLTAGVNRFKLTPIKKEWWEDKNTKYPAVIVNSDGSKMKIIMNDLRKVNKAKHFHKTGWRLATKAELLSLYTEEDND